jgi:hypothetical protein
MQHRSILKWTAIPTLSVAITLLLLSLNQHDSAAAAKAKTKVSSQTQGSLQALTPDGKPAGDCPLKHTAVKAEVSGFLSRVTVTQEFENPYPDKIEAVYTFPLPQSAAVDDLTMLIGDRTVKGKIMRREEAKAAYESAKSLGKVASLLDQERPNIFTQSLANIMPGQQISVTISYVETLKYNDGSYEWTFPMVVAPRYIPAGSQKQQADAGDTGESENVPDAARILRGVHGPDARATGMRAGHDVSLEVTIDAGVPVDILSSKTHEVDVERTDERRAVVRLKDQATIPNKDFVLQYQVAGQKIEDAVLAHRTRADGFFTLILQPPQRVTAEDVMPKELVFVLDTSGSMEGFPLDKAKETMKLALKNLYPHDMFNVITFAGDTKVLFPEPVPATEENLKKARDFLSGRKSDGGTEMMAAIRAALEPSDSQQHVRIACFMTDGIVGNDMEIISEVQKHPNARVFAMGFSDAPNRFLLDKMAQYGRGEVEYVSEKGNTAAVARRFNERIRNPLLTDLSVEWEGLAVSDVYPTHIPDLFSAKPVMLTGRYTSGGKGTIRLRGMMAGQKFVREIPVELPDAEARHDVLGTLWARQRIDELMAQDMAGLQAGKMRQEPREEITQLGLEFKLMTQFTSFVAIDHVIFTPGGDPRRVDVPVEAPQNAVTVSTGSGGINATVTVTSGSSGMINTDSADLSTNIESRNIDELPIQGRSVQSLVLLAPGTVSAAQNQSSLPSQTNVSVNGQSPNSNLFSVDGVSANFGIAAGGESPGTSAAGSTPALTASGGASGLASLSGTQEVNISTTHLEPEYGRVPGAQVSIVTRAGTNQFHGSLFQYFGNNSVDAGDWFANSRGLRQPARRLNNFGGTFGGPVRKDRIFFFSAYEGLRLRQPMTAITDVPSLAARQAAPAGMRLFLEAFPAPNGAARPDGFAEFASSFTNPARHDVATFRLDDGISNDLRFSGHYSFADSAASERGQGGFSLNTSNRIRSRSHALTGVLSYVVTSRIVTELRANYSRLGVHGSYVLDDFGGGTVPTGSASSVFSVANGSFNFNLNGRGAALMTGNDVVSTQRQLNLVGATTVVSGNHEIKFGADYRRMSPIIGLRTSEESALFDGVAQALTGVASRVSAFTRSGSQRPIFNNLSLYAQDQWKATRLTLTYGLRWELNPAPSASDGLTPLAVTQVADPSLLSLAPAGTSLWRPTYGNFAPRAGFAYQLSNHSDREMILRGGVGVFYDLGHDQAGDAFANSFPFLAGRSVFNAPFPVGGATPAAGAPITVPFYAFDPALKLPYSWQWHLSLERALGSSQTISAAYIGSAGSRLLSTQTLFGPNPDFAFVRLTTNGASSDYHSMQLQFNRRFSRKLSGLVSYTWSRSLDNSSQDSASRALLMSADPVGDRGPSDFDVRHVLTGTVSYQLPPLVHSGFGNTLLRKWIIDSIFSARSARPVNVVYDFPTSFGFAYLRPDLVNGVPLYLFDSTVAGGRRINPAAFLAPADARQGTLGRNSLRGFPLSQIDLALRRRFELSERFSLQLTAEAFNFLNHPNFADPLGSDTSLGSRFDPLGALHPNATFGQSASLNGRSVLSGGAGGFGSFYSAGGPRTLRFSVKLMF